MTSFSGQVSRYINICASGAVLWKHLRRRNALKQSFRAYEVFHNAVQDLWNFILTFD